MPHFLSVGGLLVFAWTSVYVHAAFIEVSELLSCSL